MKLFIFYALCCMVLLSCKKENIKPAPVENSNQQLIKITSTGEFGGGSYTVLYEFDSAGRIVREDNTVYERDKLQRIIRVRDLGKEFNGTFVKGNDVVVHYSDSNPNEVAYTICNEPEINATDSTVYLHESGNLSKIMSYYISNAVTNNKPDTLFLLGYYVFKYDDRNNLLQMDTYAIDYKGLLIHCSQSLFGSYDNKINPLYTDDEVRVVESACQSMLNSSKNNFTRGNGYTKIYDYRADGRPRTCLVQQNGRNVRRLLFEYN